MRAAMLKWAASACDVTTIQDEWGFDAAWAQFNSTLALALPDVHDVIGFDWIVVNGVGFRRIGSGSSQPAKEIHCVNRH